MDNMSTIGVKEFHYAKLSKEPGSITEAIKSVKFIQNITVTPTQEVHKQYGDDTIAQMATSNGPVNISSTFGRVPLADKKVLYGFKEIDGLTAYGENAQPPFVAIVFARTFADGSKEWFGLLKGMFKVGNTAGQTKQEGIEYQTEETTAEFMAREIEGQDEKFIYLLGKDEPGETTQRDALFKAIFGQPFPGSVPEGA